MAAPKKFIKKYVSKLAIKMSDGSTYRPDNEHWEKAIQMRMEDPNWKTEFITAVAHHWEMQTTPNKFGSEDPWTTEYKNQAALAQDVLYPNLRAILMGMMLSEASGGKSKVIALGRNGKETVYPDNKPFKGFDKHGKPKTK